jgi:hypothetical protein
MQELTALPAEFTAGTTVEYRRAYADYPASAGWRLVSMLRGASGEDVRAVADGDDFLATLAATMSARYAASSCRGQGAFPQQRACPRPPDA